MPVPGQFDDADEAVEQPAKAESRVHLSSVIVDARADSSEDEEDYDGELFELDTPDAAAATPAAAPKPGPAKKPVATSTAVPKAEAPKAAAGNRKAQVPQPQPAKSTQACPGVAEPTVSDDDDDDDDDDEWDDGSTAAAADLQKKEGWKKDPRLLPPPTPSAEAEALFQQALACAEEGTAGGKDKARELFEQAARKGHVTALRMLGDCYAYGDGAPIDKGKASELWEAAGNLVRSRVPDGGTAGLGLTLR